MNNYEYIIAGLPVLLRDSKGYGALSGDEIIAQIREVCSEKDDKAISFLLEGLDESTLDEEFYRKALSHKDPFIREFFRFDLNVRNAKVVYLNRALGRPEGTDIMAVDGGVFEKAPEVEAVLMTHDILARERGLDSLMWDKVDEITGMDVFSLSVILAFITKVHITDRWLKLDEQAGRKMFHRLVDEVRGTFKGVVFE